MANLIVHTFQFCGNEMQIKKCLQFNVYYTFTRITEQKENDFVVLTLLLRMMQICLKLSIYNS